ncbi:BCCT family transporter [Actinomadura sp.]|uniref:BCCT family transporter n=2 Tax=Actinomadura sp. TaxID=1989 RepID=UPI0037C91407
MRSDTGGEDAYPGTDPVPLGKPARARTDWVVYGVTAVLSPAFVIWGGASTGTLSSVSETMLNWLLRNVGWLFVLGLAIGYGHYRRGRSQLISSAFAPLLGHRRATGPLSKLIDILALFAIVLILLCFALYKDVHDDPMMRRQLKGAEVLEDAVVAGVREHQGDFELQIRPSAPDPTLKDDAARPRPAD